MEIVVEGGGGVSKKFHSQRPGIHPIYATSDRSQNKLTIAPPTEDVQDIWQSHHLVGYLAEKSPGVIVF